MMESKEFNKIMDMLLETDADTPIMCKCDGLRMPFEMSGKIHEVWAEEAISHNTKSRILLTIEFLEE